ncbi:MAG: hypothetical protein KKH98_10320, partial [Spirochaetes bacterium]|nr:hypothetical protein [Spirochaetota bacterium]
MNIKKIIYSATFLLIMISQVSGLVGWEKAGRISSDKNDIYCYNPVVSANSSLLAVVWEEKRIRGNNTDTCLMISYGSSEKELKKKQLYSSGENYNLKPDLLIINDLILVSYASPDGRINLLRGSLPGKPLSSQEGVALEPRLYYDEKEEVIYLFYLKQEKNNILLKYLRSIDKGSSWSPPRTALDPRRNGGRIFFPVVYFSEEKMYIVYKSKAPATPVLNNNEKVLISAVNKETGEILSTEEVLNEDGEASSMPVLDPKNRVLVWRKHINDIWNVYAGRLDDKEVRRSVKINTQNKNCYNHITLSHDEVTRIFWVMTEMENSQIFSRRYYPDRETLGNEEIVVQT